MCAAGFLSFLKSSLFCLFAVAVCIVILAPLNLPAQPTLATIADQQSKIASPWKAEQLSAGIVAHTPNDLKPGETYSLTLYGAQNSNGQTLSDFIKRAVQNDPLSLGDLKDLKIEAATDNYATGTSAVLVNGSAFGVAYIVVRLNEKTVYLARVLVSNQNGLSARYQTETQRIVSAAVTATKNQITLAKNNVSKNTVPATGGDGLGGEIIEGIYAGEQLLDDKELRYRFRLYLYANGEYRMTDENGKPIDRIESLNNGEYKYDRRTGQISIGGSQWDLSNDSDNLKEWFCFYGRANGTPFIHGKRYRGFGWVTTMLRYVGAVDKPSLTAEKQAKIAAEAEAKRYKFVVAPGAGLKPNQIAGVMLKTEMRYNGGFNLDADIYILLTDNTIYKGFPVPPDEWDVATSRRMEPENWGRWRRDGAKFFVAWSDNPNKFELFEGSAVKPGGTSGERLNGRFGTGESGGSMYSSYWRLWGVTFSSDGRFLKDNSGGAGNYNNPLAGGAGVMPSINTIYDDEGSVTSAITENSVVAAQRRKNPNANRAGNYSIDGYVITLRYDDGRVVRQPFFFLDNDRDNIWFEGALLGLDKDKK